MDWSPNPRFSSRKLEQLSIHTLNEWLWLSNTGHVRLRKEFPKDDPDYYCNAEHITLEGITFSYYFAVWALYYNEWPAIGFEIDHIDRDRTNNKIWNLRLCSQAQNLANVRRSRQEGGYTGVYKTGGKYFTRYTVRGETIMYGETDCPVAAHLEFQLDHCRRFGEFSGWHFWRKSREAAWIDSLFEAGAPTPEELEADICARYGFTDYWGTADRINLIDPELYREVGLSLRMRWAFSKYRSEGGHFEHDFWNSLFSDR
jgi:hypothetical protein